MIQMPIHALLSSDQTAVLSLFKYHIKYHKTFETDFLSEHKSIQDSIKRAVRKGLPGIYLQYVSATHLIGNGEYLKNGLPHREETQEFSLAGSIDRDQCLFEIGIPRNIPLFPWNGYP